VREATPRRVGRSSGDRARPRAGRCATGSPLLR